MKGLEKVFIGSFKYTTSFKVPFEAFTFNDRRFRQNFGGGQFTFEEVSHDRDIQRRGRVTSKNVSALIDLFLVWITVVPPVSYSFFFLVSSSTRTTVFLSIRRTTRTRYRSVRYRSLWITIWNGKIGECSIHKNLFFFHLLIKIWFLLLMKIIKNY